MFCPRCRAEYQAGTAVCADCGVPLVDALPPLPPDALIHAEILLTTYNVGDIALVRSVLEANGIPFLFHGENFAVVDPLIQPARLLVPPEHAERARELLAGLDLNYRGITLTDRELPDDPAEDGPSAGEADDR